MLVGKDTARWLFAKAEYGHLEISIQSVVIIFCFFFLQQLGGACLKNHRQRLALTFRVDTFLDGIHKRIAVDVEDMGIRMSQCV